MLNSILEDGEQAELLIALRQMAKAFGGVQTVAEKANLNQRSFIELSLKREILPEQSHGNSKSHGFRLSLSACAPPELTRVGVHFSSTHPAPAPAFLYIPPAPAN